MSTSKFRRRKGGLVVPDSADEAKKSAPQEEFVAAASSSATDNQQDVEEDGKSNVNMSLAQNRRAALRHEKDAESIALEREYAASRKRAQPSKPSPEKDVVNQAKNVYTRRFATIAAPHLPALPDYANSKFITDPMFALLYATPRNIPTLVMLAFWASLIFIAILPFQVYFATVIVTLVCIWFAGLDAPSGTPKRSFVGVMAACFAFDYLFCNWFYLPMGLVTGLSFTLLASLDDFMYGHVGRWKNRHLKDKLLSCVLLEIALLECSIQPFTYFYITPLIVAPIGMLIQYVVLKERLCSMVRHPSLQFAGIDAKTHWLLLTMKLGIPGISSKIAGLDDDFDFSLYVGNQEDVRIQAAAESLAILWLNKFAPHLTKPLTRLFAKTIVQHHLSWMASRPSAREMEVYYKEACSLYRYDRYIRPLAIKLARFFTVEDIITEYRKTLNVAEQEKCVWIMEPKTHECGDNLLWSNIAISHNPAMIGQSDNLLLLLMYLSHVGAGFLANMTAASFFISEKISYDLVWNSAILSLVIKKLMPPKKQSENPDDEDLDSVDNTVTKGPESLTAADVALSLKHYLARYETERFFVSAMGHASSITKSPALDFCLFYNVQYLRPAILEAVGVNQ